MTTDPEAPLGGAHIRQEAEMEATFTPKEGPRYRQAIEAAEWLEANGKPVTAKEVGRVLGIGGIEARDTVYHAKKIGLWPWQVFARRGPKEGHASTAPKGLDRADEAVKAKIHAEWFKDAIDGRMEEDEYPNGGVPRSHKDHAVWAKQGRATGPHSSTYQRPYHRDHGAQSVQTKQRY